MTETSDEPEVETTDMDMTIRRTFDAPRERVFEAWTDPEDVMQWWGPEGFTCPVARMDFREGGTSLVCMRSPEGQDLYNTWTYRNIVPDERIEFILNFTNEAGEKLDPAEIGMPPGVPNDVRHVVTFDDLTDDTSEMTVAEYGYTSDRAVEMSEQGMEQCLDKMAAIVAPDSSGSGR